MQSGDVGIVTAFPLLGCFFPYWQRQVDEAHDKVHAARSALSECESSGYYDDEGEYQEPDCSSEEDEVQEAEGHLTECESNLETVKQWRHRIESRIVDFQNDMHRLSILASERTGSAQAFLTRNIAILDSYANGVSSLSSNLCVQGENAKIKFGELPLAFTKIDAALLWANEHMHPDHLKLSASERDALRDYQLNSEELNAALWQKLSLSPHQRSQAHHLQTVFARAKTPVALKVWHGGESENWKEVKVGKTIITDGFLSTTLAEQFQDFDRGAWIEIILPQGTPAVFLDNLAGSPLYETEVEILLALNTRLQILSKDTVGSRLQIKAQVIT